MVAYCNAPTIDLKNVGSETVLEPNLDNFVLDAIGEGMLLALIMLAF